MKMIELADTGIIAPSFFEVDGVIDRFGYGIRVHANDGGICSIAAVACATYPSGTKVRVRIEPIETVKEVV